MEVELSRIRPSDGNNETINFSFSPNPFFNSNVRYRRRGVCSLGHSYCGGVELLKVRPRTGGRSCTGRRRSSVGQNTRSTRTNFCAISRGELRLEVRPTILEDLDNDRKEGKNCQEPRYCCSTRGREYTAHTGAQATHISLISETRTRSNRLRLAGATRTVGLQFGQAGSGRHHGAGSSHDSSAYTPRPRRPPPQPRAAAHARGHAHTNTHLAKRVVPANTRARRQVACLTMR